MTRNDSHMRKATKKAVFDQIKLIYVSVTKTFERRSFVYSVLLHIGLLIGLVALKAILQSNKQTLNLTANLPLVNISNKEIVQAQAISSEDLDKELKAYQAVQQVYEQQQIQARKRQDKIKEMEEKLTQAKQEAVRQEQLRLAEEAKQKAQEEKLKIQVEEKKQQVLREKAQKEQKEKEQKLKQEAQSKAAELERQKVLKLEQQAQAKVRQQEALKALQQSALNDLNAQSAELAAQSATQKALQTYAQAYKARIEAVWIMDDCRKISANQLPTVTVIPGRTPTIFVSSGNMQCDRSLLLAFKNVQAPTLPNDIGAKKLISEGIDFQFGEQG
ncbi:hypothetical protein [Fastidiosibacter lacustris]|uniref:hypothetical protein n=1 Tax=Fastidiosibacter lacustris TaxID=2056695 RepID=UPI000E35042B|nr:hypothetical protein [Fastidiosibacter lacustris]